GLLREESEPSGLRRALGYGHAHWQWCHRKHSSSGDQPALEGAEHLLVSRQRRGDPTAALVLQGGTLEAVETHGYFAHALARSVTGNLGMRPLTIVRDIWA